MIAALIPILCAPMTILLVAIAAYRVDDRIRRRRFANGWHNFASCLRDAGMAAAFESRMWSGLAAPLVIRVDPTHEREIADRLRSMSGVGGIVRAYKRCRYKFGRGNGGGYPTGTRCGLEEGHGGCHFPHAHEEHAS